MSSPLSFILLSCLSWLSASWLLSMCSCYPPQKPGCSQKMSFPLTPSFSSYLFLLSFSPCSLSLALLALPSLSFSLSYWSLRCLVAPPLFCQLSEHSLFRFSICLSSQTFPYFISSSAFPFPLHCNSSLPPSFSLPFFPIPTSPSTLCFFPVSSFNLSPLHSGSLSVFLLAGYRQPCPPSLSAVTIQILL